MNPKANSGVAEQVGIPADDAQRITGEIESLPPGKSLHDVVDATYNLSCFNGMGEHDRISLVQRVYQAMRAAGFRG